MRSVLPARTRAIRLGLPTALIAVALTAIYLFFLLVEKVKGSPVSERGGNTAYTDGLMRTVYDGEDDIKAYCADLTDGVRVVEPDGGWVLVSNSESVAPSGAGSSAIRFRKNGKVASAYRILAGTNANCAGGGTPWGRWLSCEEHDFGHVWECDPARAGQGIIRPALGTFNHEAAAVDPVGRAVYLTEDKVNRLRVGLSKVPFGWCRVVDQMPGKTSSLSSENFCSCSSE